MSILRAAHSTFIFLLFIINPLSQAYAEDAIKIVVLGDSLTAGYQLPAEHAFPQQLEKKLRSLNYNVKIANSGVSGDTTSGGLARLDWSVPEGTEAVLVQLGANDALRGISTKETRNNLDNILQKLSDRGIRVLLAGMEAPRGLGPEYTEEFRNIFIDLSKKHATYLYPFFLEGIALKPELNLSDGMHPNAKGVSVIVENILPTVEKLVKSIRNN